MNFEEITIQERLDKLDELLPRFRETYERVQRFILTDIICHKDCTELYYLTVIILQLLGGQKLEDFAKTIFVFDKELQFSNYDELQYVPDEILQMFTDEDISLLACIYEEVIEAYQSEPSTRTISENSTSSNEFCNEEERQF